MNLTSCFEFIGRASEWFFINVIENLKNMPNLVFIAIGTVTFLIWMWQMAKYNKEAAENGTYK
jgi:hypothetical protein